MAARWAGLAAAVALTIAGCGDSGRTVTITETRPAVTSSQPPSTAASSGTTATSSTAASPGSITTSSRPRKRAGILAGKTVGIDPGHNGRNYTDPTYINHLIWNGRELQPCNTTGTETDYGYTESQFNFNVASYLAVDLRAEGAMIVITRTSNDGIGPCVNTRTEMINQAHADVSIEIHADGADPSGRGFAILEPIADGINAKVITASERFGLDLRAQFQGVAGMPESNYDGVNGIVFRDDLAGLNLTTVPKVLIECGNMRNATDAALLVTPAFQQSAAKAIAQAITEFLKPDR